MGSGGSRSLWPPGKLFESEAAGLAPRRTELQSGWFFVFNAIVAFAQEQSLLCITCRVLTVQVKPLEVIWSSLTGN